MNEYLKEIYNELKLEEYTIEQIDKALKELYYFYNFPEDYELVLNDLKHDYLTGNVTRNGREVLWYMDESLNVAIYVDTLEQLTDEEIEKELI
jgi:hypothetical protein